MKFFYNIRIHHASHIHQFSNIDYDNQLICRISVLVSIFKHLLKSSKWSGQSAWTWYLYLTMVEYWLVSVCLSVFLWCQVTTFLDPRCFDVLIPCCQMLNRLVADRGVITRVTSSPAQVIKYIPYICQPPVSSSINFRPLMKRYQSRRLVQMELNLFKLLS